VPHSHRRGVQGAVMEGPLAGREKAWEYLVPIGIGLSLTVLLALALRDVVREVIVIPLLYVLWIGQLLLHSVPQVVCWSVFLIAAFLVALLNLAQWEVPQRALRATTRRSSGQVAVWAKRIRLMGRGGYTGWYFGQHVEKLIVDVLAYRERLSTRETRHRVKAGDLDAPPEVRAYFAIVLLPSRYRWRIASLLRFRLRPGRRAQGMSLDESDVAQVVRFLENQLEVGYDDRNR
jgi:hypothetical protein